jgi:LacI family transcriptional regulator
LHCIDCNALIADAREVVMSPLKRVAVVMQPAGAYCRGVIRGVASVGAQARWECVLVTAEPPPHTLQVGPPFQGFIGLLSAKPLLGQIERARVPAVDVSPQHRGPRLPQVSTDDLAVGRLAAEHLLSLGLPHFGFFGSRAEYHSLLREQGFKEALRAAHGNGGEEAAGANAGEGAAGAGPTCHVFLDDEPHEPFRVADEHAAAGAGEGPLHEWVRRLPTPVGIMASNDGRALDLLAACRKLGVAVPASAAVVGVDNDEVLCELAYPTLTSVALATQQIGYEAARMLDRMMDGEDPSPRRVLVPPVGVVPRQSSDIPAIQDADVAAAVRFIAMHVQDHLQVEDVLREVALSRRTLEQRFLRALGRTPAAEIRRAQIKVAKRLLAETNEPMERIALAAGFSNAKQLGATFHRETGMTPTSYRRRYRR